MRKLLAILMTVVLAGSIVGCSRGVAQEEYDQVAYERDSLKSQLEQLQGDKSGDASTASDSESKNESSSSQKKEGFNEESVIKQLKITKYEYTNSIKTPWVILGIHNGSDYDLNISIELSLKDKDGNIIGVSNQSTEAFESGCDTALDFMCDEPYDSIEYNIEVEEEQFYDCVLSALSYKVNSAKNKAIISVTNNGDTDAEFVEYTAIFFKDKKVVSHTTGYTVDQDSQLKKGQSKKAEADCYENFDKVKVYLSGRA